MSNALPRAAPRNGVPPGRHAEKHVATGEMLQVAEPCLGLEEQAAVIQTLADGWITMGPRVRAFEVAFAQLHNAPDAVAVGSCTAALHLLLRAFGIGEGDEVLVPSLTFVASANCVLYVGATPVMVDVESLSMPLMSMEDAAAKCSPRTRAIILVHYAGGLGRLSMWREFARQRGLVLIEDSAHAIGIAGAGGFGDGAAFSFYGNKNMTTAEGGMVLARDPAVLEAVRQMRGHGLTSATFQRHRSGLPHYDVPMLGYNYRMDDLRAAIGLVQIERLPKWNETRQALCCLYRAMLARQCPSVLVPFSDDQVSAHHIMPVLLPAGTDRERVIIGLREDGIQTTIHYPPVHKFTYYSEILPAVRLPVTEEYCERELTLPLHPRMDGIQVERVVAALANSIDTSSTRKSGFS